MAFRILDASAFYAGVPFGSTEKYYTSTQIFDEISHIKEKHGAIDVLLSTGRLDVRQASQESCNVVKKASVESGDAQTLSESDVSLLNLQLLLRFGSTGTDDGEIVYTVIFLPRKIFATFMDAFSDSFDPNLLMMATLRSFNQNKIFYITLKTVVFWAQKYMGY